MSYKNISSYHIFSFPFKIDSLNGENDFYSKTKLSDIDNIIQGAKWEKIKYGENYFQCEKNENNKNINYSTEAYFYNNIRKAIYTKRKNEKSEKDDQITLNYKYSSNNKVDKYIIEYIMDVNNNEKIEKYILDIKSIQLKIYETGVGILSFFIENNEYYSLEDVLKINNLGRRVYPPFLEEKNGLKRTKKSGELPNEISITFKDNYNIKEDFKEKNSFDKEIIGKHIIRILDFDFNKIKILPVLDDRMHVISYYTKYTDEHFENFSESDNWYKYVYVDSGDIKCQNKDMKSELIKNSTYSRWSELGTYYGVSRCSFVLFKNKEAPKYLEQHIKTMYYEMVTLILAQRASILNFYDEISRISSLDEGETTEIKQLYKNYLQFTNRLYFREVTAQDQGIELYNMLLSSANINNEIKCLKNEMKSLHEYARLIESDKSQKSLETIENLNRKYIIPSFITGLLGINIFQNSFEQIEGFLELNFKYSSLLGSIFNIAITGVVIFWGSKYYLEWNKNGGNK